MNFKRAVKRSIREDGFTFMEIIMASLILTLIVAAVVQYHSTSGASRGQEYYLKAVEAATSELEKLRAFYELKYDDPNVKEFDQTGLPQNISKEKIYLFKFIDETSIKLPVPIFHVYYNDRGYKHDFLRSIEAQNTTKDYKSYYVSAFNNYNATDAIDKRTFTYFTDDGDTDTDSNVNGKVDASIAVIDDMGNPADPGDDLLGNIGWWVENVPDGEPDITAIGKKITFVLQFWYPGQDWTTSDPEVIVLKTTVVKP